MMLIYWPLPEKVPCGSCCFGGVQPRHGPNPPPQTSGTWSTTQSGGVSQSSVSSHPEGPGLLRRTISRKQRRLYLCSNRDDSHKLVQRQSSRCVLWEMEEPTLPRFVPPPAHCGESITGNPLKPPREKRYDHPTAGWFEASPLDDASLHLTRSSQDKWSVGVMLADKRKARFLFEF